MASVRCKGCGRFCSADTMYCKNAKCRRYRIVVKESESIKPERPKVKELKELDVNASKVYATITKGIIIASIILTGIYIYCKYTKTI